jgi:hypothetical protein
MSREQQKGYETKDIRGAERGGFGATRFDAPKEEAKPKKEQKDVKPDEAGS